MTTKPPQPPSGTKIHLNPKAEVWAPNGLRTWKAPAAQVTVQAVDNTGKRVTATRVALMGPLALAAKKASGTVSVILSAPGAGVVTVEVPAKHAAAVLTWAAAFNAWRESGD